MVINLLRPLFHVGDAMQSERNVRICLVSLSLSALRLQLRPGLHDLIWVFLGTQLSCRASGVLPEDPGFDSLAWQLGESHFFGKPALEQQTSNTRTKIVWFSYKHTTGYQKTITPQDIRKRCFKLEKSRKSGKARHFNSFATFFPTVKFPTTASCDAEQKCYRTR